ncbi:hypothetical protein VOLCADRAFT_90884 [Volvox carteri f. nagariensis]|uniref:BTB domain-containing protein n=1 Tax=Volvox carteri f. nagariensis TaxID=3068 RepID=D8TVB5_VOLCA|nr:uncharacterized protein VOLCADRAFT_90884 [Volvox carteri f. nagariensis]EFJ48549.1 hypothetical protein VOLCADRAFT_90884 [Volvox carteri f. nagariensis]|eukprot:XP_002950348.1 hypothetical protein VOLCADRAFT_90884 [Volvox carteri f. nagariensis]
MAAVAGDDDVVAARGDGAAVVRAAVAAEQDVGEVEDLPAHRVVLAATCEYFRALLTGAGANMSDMATAAAAGQAAAAVAAAAAAAPLATAMETAAVVVSLPGLDGWALRLAVGALYERRVEITADNLEGLISAASYLGAAALLDACTAFIRSSVGLSTCLPLLLLSWRYQLSPLRDELLGEMSYVCRRFSVLVRMPLSNDSSSGGDVATEYEYGSAGSDPDSVSEVLRLSSLPLELLLEVLRSEELLTECESDVLQCALEWLVEQELPDGPQAPYTDIGTAVGGAAGGGSSSLGDSVKPGSSNGCSNPQPPCIDSCKPCDGTSRISDTASAARELVRLVNWDCLPDPPHLHMTRGSLAAQTRALALLLAAYAEEHLRAPASEALSTTAAAVVTAAAVIAAAFAPAEGAGGSAVPPPAVLRLRRLLAELQAAATAVDLAPHGPATESTAAAAAAPSPPSAGAVAAASLAGAVASNGGGGINGALRRIGAVVSSDVESRAYGGIGGGSGRRRRHLASCLLAAGGHDASWRAVKAVEVYDPRTDQWMTGPSLLQGLSFTGAAMVPGSGFGFEFGSGIGSTRGSCGAVYLVGGTPLCSSVWRLPWGGDGPMGRGWEPCPPLLMPRAHAGVVAVAGTLTVLGGRSQVQQRGPDMVLPRSAHACAVLGGRIFALGGAAGGGARGGGGGGGGGTHRSGEFLDLGSGRWHLLPCDMSTERKYTAAAAHGGRLYVCGGVKDSRTRLPSLEALDPREGRWATLEPMTVPRSSHSMAALGGHLYVAGGQCSSVDIRPPATFTSAAVGIGAGGTPAATSAAAAAWGWGPARRTLSPPAFPGGNFSALGSSPPSLPYGHVSAGGSGVYGSAPGPGGARTAAGLLGLGLGGGGAAAAGAIGVAVGSGGGGGCEDMTVLSAVECFDVAAGRWRVAAPLSHGGRAGLALSATLGETNCELTNDGRRQLRPWTVGSQLLFTAPPGTAKYLSRPT